MTDSADMTRHLPGAGPIVRTLAACRRHAAALARGHVTWEAFCAITLASCLFLQRLALPAAGLKISVATPVVLALAAWALLEGTLVVEWRRLQMFLGLVAVALFSTAVHINVPIGIAPRISTTSLLYWLAVTAFATLRFRRPVDQDAFFAIASWFLQVMAIAGIAQFLLQFVGLGLFTFRDIIPDQFLIEEQYNVVIPMDSGMLKSNGFFEVEPSVFSQMMALGIMFEVLQGRRLLRLAVLFAGLLLSFSGTGWMVFGTFVAVLAVGAGRRGLFGAVMLVIIGTLAFTALSYALPDAAAMMTSRVNEFALPGSSGHLRFVTPFQAIEAVWQFAPWTAVTGVGPGAAELLAVPFLYSLESPVKILLEYGWGGLFFYMALLITGQRTRAQLILLLPCLVLLMVTGGYHQFSPILFPIVLVCDVAFLRDQPVKQDRLAPALRALQHA